MRHLLLTILVALTTSGPARAESGLSANPIAESTQIVRYKDPFIAAYLSATLPGVGQMYTGHKGRGFLVLLGVAASLGTAAALYEPAQLGLSDYDRIEYGGDGDGLLNTAEITNWEKKEFEDDAFSALSGGRKAGVITAGVVGLGLYIWNIFDARKLAKKHNRDNRISVGPRISPGSAGAALSLRF